MSSCGFGEAPERPEFIVATCQKLVRGETGEGIVWLTVSSSAPGMQGYFTPASARAWAAKEHWNGTAILLDSAGRIGRAYGAKNTPHMFIINPQGQLIYNGAIDDKSTSDPGDINGAKNYVSEALQEARAGQPVAVASTRPYGCSVKYAD